MSLLERVQQIREFNAVRIASATRTYLCDVYGVFGDE